MLLLILILLILITIIRLPVIVVSRPRERGRRPGSRPREHAVRNAHANRRKQQARGQDFAILVKFVVRDNLHAYVGASRPPQVLRWAQHLLGMVILVDGKMCGPDVAIRACSKVTIAAQPPRQKHGVVAWASWTADDEHGVAANNGIPLLRFVHMRTCRLECGILHTENVAVSESSMLQSGSRPCSFRL